jgi:hypothetical protein
MTNNMNSTIFVKRDDSSRTLIDTLLYSDGSPIDLTGATVKLIWNNVKKDATIVAATLGQVSYHLTEDDVRNVGTIILEWEVTFADESQLTIPTQGHITLRILPTLDT